MINELFFAIIQAVTEFFPISSSGHLALISNLISKPNLFFFTTLHLASLLAVLAFTKKELSCLLTFRKEYRKLWLYLIIATIPAALIGYFFRGTIEKAFSSFLFLGVAFLFTSIILFLTKFTKVYSKLNIKNSLLIGLFQILGIFPGISRSGMTISAALFSGVDKEKAIKFSFLLFIPLSICALILESGEFYLTFQLVLSFFICLILSFLSLNLLYIIIKRGKFWVFSFYCLAIAVISFILYLF